MRGLMETRASHDRRSVEALNVDRRIQELLHVGDEIRHAREADAGRRAHGGPRHGPTSWIGRHLIVAGRAIAGDGATRPSSPELN
jgi:hypothetical protein